MFIEEVIIDGFKSYASRTVIGGWDSKLNAITGLNGSGKSNILDALCFVMGIENIKQVMFHYAIHQSDSCKYSPGPDLQKRRHGH